MRPYWLAGIALVLTQGCASVTPNDTLPTDWHAVGYTDGVNGDPAEKFRSYRSGGQPLQAPADIRAYHAGRAEGLRIYCDPRNGFALGARGGHYDNVCPMDLEPGFIETYALGRMQYEQSAVSGRIDPSAGDSPD